MTTQAPPRPAAAAAPEPELSFVGRLLRPAAPLRLTPTQAGVLAAGIGGFTLVVGLLLGPAAALLLLAALVGAGVAGTAVGVPAVALGLMVVTEFTNVSGVFEDRSPVSIYTGVLALGVLSALVALARPQYRARVRARWWLPLALFVVYLTTLVPATVLSQAPAASAGSLDDSLKDAFFLAVALLLMQLAHRPWMIAAGIALALAPIAGLTALNEYVVGNGATFGGFSTIASSAGASIATARHAGPLPDSNFWGRFLVLGLPFVLALVHRAGHAGHRLAQGLWVFAAFLIALGVYLTQSRGTLLAAGFAVLVWIVASGPVVRRHALYLTPVLLVGLLVPGIGDRLLTITETVNTPDYAADASIVERGNVLQVAIEVFRENPLFGTGPGSFGAVISEYGPRSGGGSTGDITATHNLYMEIASETGVVGLFGWAVFLGGSILLAISATVRLAGGRRDGRHGAPSRQLAAASVASLVGWATCSIFLHQSYARTLMLACAFAGWLYSYARSEPSLFRPAAAESTIRAMKGLRFGVVATTATALLAVATAGVLYAALERPSYVATAELTLKATPNTYVGYATDVRRRVVVLPTYASVIQYGTAQPDTAISADPSRGLMTVRSVGATAAEATARRDAVVSGAPGAIGRASMDAAYSVVTVDVPPVGEQRPFSSATIRIVALAVIFEIAVVVALSSWLRGRVRRNGPRFA